MKNFCIHLPLSIMLYWVTCLYSKPEYTYSSNSLFVILHSLLALTYNGLFFHCVSLIIQHNEIYIFIYLKVSWGSVVGLATKESLTIESWQGLETFLPCNMSRPAQGQPNLPFNEYRSSFPGVRWLRCNEPYALITKVKYERHSTSIPPVYF
jgi:hypothetical protein